MLAYLGMSYLYKRANWLWPLLIRHRLTHALWSPLVEVSRRRHLRFRERLRARPAPASTAATGVEARRATTRASRRSRAPRLPVYAAV